MFGLPNPYLIIGALAGAIFLSGGSFVAGVRYANKSIEINQLKADLAIAKADARNAVQAEQDAKTKQVELEAAANKDQETLDALNTQLEAQPDACRAKPSDVDSLLKLGAGQAHKP